jgi:hypothetical protein
MYVFFQYFYLQTLLKCSIFHADTGLPAAMEENTESKKVFFVYNVFFSDMEEEK